MATIKAHAFVRGTEDDGLVNCDYRGQGELKGKHKTLGEKEFGESVATNDEIEFIIANGPELNAVLKKLTDIFGGQLPFKPEGWLGDVLNVLIPDQYDAVKVGVYDH